MQFSNLFREWFRNLPRGAVFWNGIIIMFLRHIQLIFSPLVKTWKNRKMFHGSQQFLSQIARSFHRSVAGNTLLTKHYKNML